MSEKDYGMAEGRVPRVPWSQGLCRRRNPRESYA